MTQSATAGETQRGGWSKRMRTMRPAAVLSATGVLLLTAAAIFAPYLAPYDPLATDAAQSLQPPSAAHWAGTDQLGRDIFSRLIVASRLDLMIAVASVALSFAIGSVVGAFTGYIGGKIDMVIGRLVDVLMAFPLFILAMALIAALGNSYINIIYATAIINLPFYIRLARAEVNARRGAGWVEAARLSGNSHARIVLFFLLPNIIPVMMVQISLNLGWAILNAAGLSFIGLGIQPPTPEWGIMVAEGAGYISSGRWWLVAFPGLTLMFAVLCFNLLGDSLRDIFDPRGK
jgi:peptide/nickel transport system permease protein